MLTLLLGLQVETGQAPEVLLADGLVDGGASSDSLAVVVSRVGPPVGLGLHVAQDHALDGLGQSRHLRAQSSQQQALHTAHDKQNCSH